MVITFKMDLCHWLVVDLRWPSLAKPSTIKGFQSPSAADLSPMHGFRACWFAYTHTCAHTYWANKHWSSCNCLREAASILLFLSCAKLAPVDTCDQGKRTLKQTILSKKKRDLAAKRLLDLSRVLPTLLSKQISKWKCNHRGWEHSSRPNEQIYKNAGWISADRNTRLLSCLQYPVQY